MGFKLDISLDEYEALMMAVMNYKHNCENGMKRTQQWADPSKYWAERYEDICRVEEKLGLKNLMGTFTDDAAV